MNPKETSPTSPNQSPLPPKDPSQKPPGLPPTNPQMPEMDAPAMPGSPAEQTSVPEFLSPQAGAPATPANTPFDSQKDAINPVDEAFRQQTADLQPLPVRPGRVRSKAILYAVSGALKRVVKR